MTALDYPPDLYYRRSGKAPFAGTTLAAILSWIAVAVLAGAYAYADLYIKVVDKLSALILMAFAAAMGFAVYGILRWGQVRSMLVALVIALSSAALAVYTSWVVWEYAIIQRVEQPPPMWEMFSRPDAIYAFARQINEEGTFSMSKRDVKGTELWLFWTVEAACILGAIVLIPLIALRNLAFCETCSAWCKRRDAALRVQYGDENALRQNMEAKNFSHLAALGPADSETPVHFRVDLYGCPKCPQTNLVTVNRATVTYDKKAQRSESVKKVIDRLWLTDEQVKELLGLPAQWHVAAAATADAPAPEAQGKVT